MDKNIADNSHADIREIAWKIDSAAGYLAVAEMAFGDLGALFEAIAAATPGKAMVHRLADFGSRLCADSQSEFQCNKDECNALAGSLSITLSSEEGLKPGLTAATTAPVPLDCKVSLTEPEAEALSAFIGYSTEMGNILRTAMPVLEKHDGAMAARAFSLTQESEITLFRALARLRRGADALRASANSKVGAHHD